MGLSIGTRPDCLPEETIALLREIHAIKPVTVELGLQTADDRVACYINRGYETAVYADAVTRLKQAGLEVVTHIIIGRPGDDPVQTTRYACDCGTDGVKFHLLHVLKNTKMAEIYLDGGYTPLEKDEYVSIVADAIERLPENTVVCRVTGDGMADDLLAPEWSRKKVSVINDIDKLLFERQTYQGALFKK